METKFKHGDICKTKTSGQVVMVINYKINQVGGVINFFTKSNDFPESVITDDVLCEFEIKGKITRQYIKEANLELMNLS